MARSLFLSAVAVTVITTTLGATTVNKSVILPLNVEKTFQCKAIAVELVWYVNETAVIHLNDRHIVEGDQESLGNGVLRQNLTVRVTCAIDNTILTCEAVSTSDFFSVHEIHIKVQGYLKAPECLSLHMVNDSAVKLQWKAPFTLNITDVEPDIMYYTIHITHDDTQREVSVSGNAVEYVYVSEPCRDTTYYTFSITAWNVVGAGEIGTFPGQNILTASSDWSLEVISIGVSLLDETAEVTTILQILSNVCPGRQLPEMCTIEVVPSNGRPETFSIMVDFEANLTIQLHNNLLCFINSVYNIKIQCDGSEVTERFTTYSTQSATVTANHKAVSGTVDVECRFAANSSAQGCVVGFARGLDCELELYRNKDQLYAVGQIVLPEGTFNPEAYDIDTNGLRLWKQPAVIMEGLTIVSSSTSVCAVKTDQTVDLISGSDDNDILLLVSIAAALSALCAILAVLVIVLGVIVCVLIKRQRSNNLIALQGNMAYDTVLPRVQELQPCAAYGVGRRRV